MKSNSTSKSSSSITSIKTIVDLSSPNQKKSPTKYTSVLSGFPNTPGRTLSDSSVPNKDYSLVRNHWLNKFSNNGSNVTKDPIKKVLNSTSSITTISSNGSESRSNTMHVSSNGLKRISSESANAIPEKIPKLCVDLTNTEPKLVECPICSMKCPYDELNHHIDHCLNKTKQCIVCDKNIPELDYQEHLDGCCNKGFEDDVFIEPNQKNENDIDDMFVISPEKKGISSNKTPGVKFDQCSVCDKPIESSVYGIHLSDCLQKMYEKIESAYVEKNVKCPVCEKELPESNLSEHLENCRDLSDIFEDDGNVPAEEDEENKENACPICSKSVKIKEMNSHIDVCLNIGLLS